MSRLALSELDRAAQQAVRIGVVSALDAGAGLIKVAIGDLETGWIPWLTPRAGGDRAWWAPETGEQVLVLTPAGRGEQAVALPALFSDARPAPADRPTVHRTVYADGAVLEYDRAAHRLTAELPSGGTVLLVAPGGVTVSAAGGVSIAAAGGVSIAGDVTVQGSVSATGVVSGDGISLSTHTHRNVEPGSGSSGPPNR